MPFQTFIASIGWPMRMLQGVVLALLAAGLTAMAHAQDIPPSLKAPITHAQAIVLTPDTRHVNLGTQVERWVDPGRQADLAQAQKRHDLGDFQSASGLPPAGFTLAAHWLRVAVAPQASARSDWILNIGANYLNDVQVWVPGPDGQWQHHQRGDRFTQEPRPFPARANALHLSLPPGKTSVIWVRVQTTSALNITLDLWQPEAYAGEESRDGIVSNSLVTIQVLVVLVFGSLGLAMKDRVLLTFSVYMSMLALLEFCKGGALQLFWPVRPWWASDLLVGIGALGVLPASNFMWIELMDMRQNFKRLAQSYRWSAWAVVATLPLVVTDFYSPLANIVFMLVIPVGLGNTYASITLWRRRQDQVNVLYVVAFMVRLVGTLTEVALLMGLLPRNALTTVANPASTFVMAALMVVAMIMRISRIQRDKNLAEQGVALAAAQADNQRRFVAMLTHEFRNPLAGIDRAANVMASVPDQQPADVRRRLDGIRTQVGRLNTLVDSFLLSESSEQSRLSPQLKSVNMENYLREVKLSLSEEMHTRVVVHAEPMSLQAQVDVRLLTLALHNLLDNALRYAPESSAVILSARLQERSLLVTVVDHGPGLAEEELLALGTPYYRANSAIGSQGTGLGYHFCRSIAQAHGGCIEAKNQPEGGLSVTMHLPQ
jgi:two-component system, sensor histidine kinase LadS